MQVYSVSDFVNGVNSLLAGIPAVVQGEVSGFRIAQNRFVWFDLKDEGSVVSCFMLTFQLQTVIEDGMQVQVTGAPGLFKKSGKFHLKANKVEIVGEGGLRKQYEELKLKLEREGLFDDSRKRVLPRFPQRIGVVTSEDAAAFTDVKRVLANRWPSAEITLFHVQVQGDSAPNTLLQAFHEINTQYSKKLDVVIITRGGGAIEDLQAFNDERVVRAVYALQVPTIVGVGHERDETLVEFVADKRASTPSNAAEFAVPHKDDVLYQLSTLTQSLANEVDDIVDGYERRIQSSVFVFDQFARSINVRVKQLQQEFSLATSHWEGRIQQQLQSIKHVKTLLVNAHPAKILARGYSITKDATGKVIRSADTVKPGQSIRTQVADGEIESNVV